MFRRMKVFTYLLITLVIGSIGFLLFITIQGKGNPNQIPTYFGYKPLTVLTNSMEPAINAGDMIFIKAKQAAAVKKGDIITFKLSEDKLITHRVATVTHEGFLTKGDNNNVEDEWVVDPANMIGEVKFILPNAGYIAKFLAGKIGFALFILLPLLLFFLIEVYQRVYRNLEKQESKGTSTVPR
ncbi:signal peptidase I [Neobacillus sp. OS1-2]|uniref:signal peptidase I n=1 Tax=Neobacillus sp. OS1-2 TaxID=3070680 RepID=UPI0027E04985|nr:signal peptidase I [Neobacillus sp. OS1-2]WML41446.1 signal peptidase I [Neobacillus sp. OS1-2]